VDVETAKIVWVATAESGGNAYANMNDLIESMAKETLSKLKKEGITQ
jgi:hypothetical protein